MATVHGNNNMDKIQYHICKIGKNDFRIVPTNWIYEDRKSSDWPVYEDEVEINHAISTNEEPDDTWKIIIIEKIIGVHDDFKSAKDFLDILQSKNSDIDSDIDAIKLKSTRHNRHRLTHDNEGTPVKGSAGTALAKTKANAKLRVKSIVEVNESFVSIKKMSQEQSQKVTTPDVPENGLNPILNDTASNCNIENGEIVTPSLVRELLQKMNTILVHINEIDKRIRNFESLLKINKKHQSLSNPDTLIEELDKMLPLKTIDTFKDFEKKLRGESYCQGVWQNRIKKYYYLLPTCQKD